MPPNELPADAEFKGYEEVVVQDVKVVTDNVLFCKEKYYSPSQRQSYLAPLPPGYVGQFGPGVRAFVPVLYFGCQMTEPKIVELLANFGVQISEGQVSNLLIHNQERFHEEKRELAAASITTSTTASPPSIRCPAWLNLSPHAHSWPTRHNKPWPLPNLWLFNFQGTNKHFLACFLLILSGLAEAWCCLRLRFAPVY